MTFQGYDFIFLLLGLGLGGGIGLIGVMRTRKMAQATFDDFEQESREIQNRLILAEDKAQRYEAVNADKNQLVDLLNETKTKNAEYEILLTQERKQFQEKLIIVEQARQELSNAFQALSAQALERNNRSFLELAEATLSKFHETAKGDIQQKEKVILDLVSPLQQSLQSVDQKIGELEKIRLSAYDVLRHQVNDLVQSQKDLRSETSNLVKALRAPHIRGRWGEIQLRRVVEMSGMNAHCDFLEQVTLEGEAAKLRPDMIVHLPGQKRLIIDSKVPFAAYLNALETQEEGMRRNYLKDHARHVRGHIISLGARSYWDQFARDGESPEFVVMFLPSDTIFGAALEHDPELIEFGIEKRVILTTPATLIALLNSIAYGWRQERVTENAQEISKLGRELYKRLSDVGSHLTKLGQTLGSSVRAYNQTVASLESRVLPSARRFKDLEASSSQDDLAPLIQIDHVPRDLQSPEFLILKDVG